MTRNRTHKPPFVFDGARLKALREEAGMPVVDLGVRLYLDGVSKGPAPRQQIWDWENGKCRPNSATLRGLAAIFGVSMESFFKQAEN